MNEFDRFVKHDLKVKHYARYTDDFIIITDTREYLERLLPEITDFLGNKLALILHPNKVSIRTLYQGIDFLGYVTFPKHRILRTKTKRRILRAIQKRFKSYLAGDLSLSELEQSLRSYLGVLSHADAHTLGDYLKNLFWLESINS